MLMMPGDLCGIVCDCGGEFREWDVEAWDDDDDPELSFEQSYTEVACEQCGKRPDAYEVAVKHSKRIVN